MERLRARIGRAQADVGLTDPLTPADVPLSARRRQSMPTDAPAHRIAIGPPARSTGDQPESVEAAVDVVRPELRDCAEREAARIHRARALFAAAREACDEGADPADQVVASARRSRGAMYRVLNGRALVLLGVSLEDAAGRLVALRTRPLLVPRRAGGAGIASSAGRGQGNRRERIRRQLPSDDLLEKVSVSESDRLVRDDSASVDHLAFWTRSLSRASLKIGRASCRERV